MTISNQKKLSLIFGVLFFAGFLIPRVAYATPAFTAGWYEDLGSGETDATCPEGKWRASIELRNDSGEPLLVDKLTIRAVWYEEDEDTGSPIYTTTAEELASHVFETDCAIDIKNSEGTLALEVTAEKDGYYTMLAANNYRTGGSAFNQKIWRKTLYLASLGETENANIVYLFPEDDQWISDREEHSEMKLWVNKFPLSNNITQVDAEITHLATAQKFLFSQTVDVAEGEVIFSLPALTEIGEYSWRVKLVRSTPSIFYNENTISYFNFDPNPPTPFIIYGDGWSRDGETQAPRVSAQFTDPPFPSSDICKIEIYLNDGPGTPLELVNSCSWSRCSYVGDFQEYTTPITYTYYTIAYDCAGNETITEEDSFTIRPLPPPPPPDPSRLTIYSRVDNVGATGVPFEVTDITGIVGEGEVPSVGTYETTTTFVGTVDRYTIYLQAPDSYNGRPFSFWKFGSSYSNSPEKSLPIQRSYYELTMYFGVSHLMINNVSVDNWGSMDNGLRSQIYQIKPRIEQIEGTPEDLLGPGGYRDHNHFADFNKTIVGEINDLILRFNDSDDGILKFSHFSATNFCEPDPEDNQQCQGSINYGYGYLYPQYSIQRTVRVEVGTGAGGAVPVEGLEISTTTGGMQSGITAADGSYTFSSTGHPNSFTGTIQAPETITDDDGNEIEFGYWTGCQSVDGLDCYIGSLTWYYNVNVTVKAHYTSEPDPEMPFLEIDTEGMGDGTVISNPGGICCGCPAPDDDCEEYFVSGMEVTLTATPAPDSYFIGWTGDCLASGSNPTCTLIVDSYKWVGADFALKPLVTVGITGNGTVTSDPPNIDCVGPGTCSSYFNPGTDVSLIEDPDSYWEFSGWTGDCNGVGDCFLLDIHDDKTVNAAFESIGPTAIMYSFVDPAADDCRGPGCSWGSVATPWITYKNTQYKVVNASIFQDPASMYTFDWYFDGELLFSCEEPGGATSECHIENIAGMAVGDHTVQLKAADEYGSFDETTEKNIIIRPDTNADFKCSLDAADEEGQDCGDIAPLAGQEVYFIDNSVPSGGADEIIEWTWQKGHMDGGTFVRDETFGYTEKVSTALSSESDTIKLIVKDNHLRDDYYPAGRGDSETKSLAVQFPLPKYREVAPR